MKIDAYNTCMRQQVYDANPSLQSGTVEARATANDQKSSASTSSPTDQVNISTAGKLAQLRSLLGLEATQTRLTKSAITAAAENDQKVVATAVQDIASALGIPSGTNFSLYADDSGHIRVKGSFNGRQEMEKALNNDQTIVTSFNRLSVEQTMLDLPLQMRLNSQKSLLDYLSGDGDNDFTALMNQYSVVRHLNNPIDSLLYYSTQSSTAYEMPFTVKDDGTA